MANKRTTTAQVLVPVIFMNEYCQFVISVDLFFVALSDEPNKRPDVLDELWQVFILFHGHCVILIICLFCLQREKEAENSRLAKGGSFKQIKVKRRPTLSNSHEVRSNVVTSCYQGYQTHA